MPPDERDRFVDHDQLLVVAVHRTVVRVQRRLDPGPRTNSSRPAPTNDRRGAKHRRRSPRPQQHANVDRLGRLTQQLVQQAGLVADDREPRRDAPPRDQNAALRGTDRVLEHRKYAPPSISTSIALPARGGGSPVAHKRPSSGGVRCAERPQLAQPATMTSARQTLGRTSGNAFGQSKDIHRHHAQTISAVEKATAHGTHPGACRC